MITITPFTKDCIPDIIKLSRACFKRTPSRRTVRRRFATAIGFLAYDDGRPVAYYGVFDQPHQGYRSAQSGWTMTHPDYRGRGAIQLQ
jgi:RimJ/RimL family protein N-acetyltransferase